MDLTLPAYVSGVFLLTWILNRYRLVPISFVDQIIMGYGGLRGAVAYGLAVNLNEAKIKEKNLMICTTLLVVYFTVILQVSAQSWLVVSCHMTVPSNHPLFRHFHLLCSKNT